MVIETPHSYHLLIADDNRAFRETLRELLEPTLHIYADLTIHEVDSGEAAVEYSLEVRVDIVLLDMYMHELTGLETLRILKDQNALRPCILITSEATDELRRCAVEANAYSVLHKPVRRQELCDTVVGALNDAYHDPLLGN
ncbi:MAG: response regulator [Planctomycetaceae bacterium]|nr:response regulator [Planctomycetaceae bacterium]